MSNTNLTHNVLMDTSIISINNGDILRWNGTQFANSSTLTNDETILNTGIVVSTGITKTQTVTRNTPFTTTYVDGTDSCIIYTTCNSLYYPTIQALKFFGCNLKAAIASGGTYITSPTYGYNSLSNPCTNCRINIDYGFSFVPYAFNLTTGGSLFGNWYNIWLYGSNSATDFNNLSDIDVSGNTILLYTFTYSGSWSPSMGYILFTTSYSFRYYLLLSNNYGGYCNITNFSIQHGKNGSLVNGTDYTISTSNTNGSPVITYIDVSPQGILYNLDRLLVSEAYRRIYTVIYDVNNLYLSGNTGWNISSNSNSSNLCFNYNSWKINHISILLEICT